MVGGVLVYLAGLFWSGSDTGSPAAGARCAGVVATTDAWQPGRLSRRGVSSGFGEHLNVIRVHFPETLDF